MMHFEVLSFNSYELRDKNDDELVNDALHRSESGWEEKLQTENRLQLYTLRNARP